jgi:hypothetical protein
MTPRQCEIAAEAYAACILARAGYDVLVQYGANQPHYDLVAVKDLRMLPISVKGSQDGGWMLAVRYVGKGMNYHQAADKWLTVQRPDVVFVFVQFLNVELAGAPRVYVARPVEISEHLKRQRGGQGHGALYENHGLLHPKSKYDYRIPAEWEFSQERLDLI